MKEPLKSISETIAKANDKLYEADNNIDTLIGIMDKTLRKQGTPADAVTVECVKLDKKIVFMLHDLQPDIVTVALGNKAGDIFSSAHYPQNTFTVEAAFKIMHDNFTITH